MITKIRDFVRSNYMDLLLGACVGVLMAEPRKSDADK
jgi:hypothetical protein